MKNKVKPQKKSKKGICKPVYLREVQIRFKKKRVKSELVNKPLVDSRLVYELFQDLQNEAKEKLITISVDTKLKIMCFEVVAIGSLNTLTTRPIDILRGVIHVAPYGVIFVHNHPGGDPAPNSQDKRFTKKMQKQTKELGVYLLDHVIIGEEAFFSFADKGLL